jgi:Flp pilus assembly pilin Flp
MLRDNKGQGFVEYTVLVVLAVAASVAFVAIYRGIRRRGNEAANSIETLDLGY